MFDKIHEECGVFGIYNKDNLNVATEAYFALFALQHRGQVSCGIAVNNDGIIDCEKGMGIVPDVFDADTLKKLTVNGKGDIGLGHVRYSAGKDAVPINSQPLVMRYSKGTLAISNNGSLVNTEEIKRDLQTTGAIFQTNSDAELIGYLIAKARLTKGSVEEAISVAMDKLEGAYSFLVVSPRKLIGVRDPHGFRPLCIGKSGNSYMLASETCALDSLGAEFVRDVKPGEIVIIDENGIRSIEDHCGQKTSLCIFEHVYFARPDSVIDGASVHMARRMAGRYLAKEHPVDADVVIGVPDSGLDAAIGYAEESGIPFAFGFIKNRYIGRTFIQETQEQRERSVHIKLNPLSAAVKGKRVVMIDDSIVRGTTSAHIVELLRKAGATEVHMRISSPPFLNPCYFGTDISSREYLIACRLTLDEIRQEIGADSLGYLSLENLHKIAVGSKCDFCDACFTGKYPVEIKDSIFEDKFSKKINEAKK